MIPQLDAHAHCLEWGMEGDLVHGCYNFPASLPIFLGHFPGSPLVPGVYQLAAMLDLLQRARKTPDLAILSVKKVKWTAPVLPDQDLQVAFRIRSEQGGTISGSGTVVVNGDTTCQASMVLGNPAP